MYKRCDALIKTHSVKVPNFNLHEKFVTHKPIHDSFPLHVLQGHIFPL